MIQKLIYNNFFAFWISLDFIQLNFFVVSIVKVGNWIKQFILVN